MFNDHYMALITELNTVYIDPMTSIVAVVTSDMPENNNLNVFRYANILVPPTDMLMRWADGDYLILQNQYPSYLATQECDDMVVALLAGLVLRNVYIYIPYDEFEIFGEYLLQYLYYYYGIILQTSNTVFSIDPTKVPLIMSKFYLSNLMDAQDYLDAYPAVYALPDMVINKLTADLDPFNGWPQSFEQCRDYFNRLIAQRIQNKPKLNMCTIVR